MRIFIAGIDGYLGWPLAQYLVNRGHTVAGADFFFRRRWVSEMGSWSAIPIAPMNKRLRIFKDYFGQDLPFWKVDLRVYSSVERILSQFQPDTIIHLAECPSAPYSMIDVKHATFVQNNNITSTFNLLFAIRDLLPNAHLVKLGTMGEYGTPNIDIPEGFLEIDYQGRHDKLPFPRQATSWYHWSKVHTSNNIMFACKIWNLRATDIMQGIVFGCCVNGVTEKPLSTRFDFDQAFGTVLNRFCCQAVIGHPLTLYGNGYQKRGFMPLEDSMRCISLVVENPPEEGEYRVFNQFEEIHSVAELASRVKRIADKHGLDIPITKLENPRQEIEQHYYNPKRVGLLKLGYQPTPDIDVEINEMIVELMNYRSRILEKKHVLIPDVCWNGQRNKLQWLESDLRQTQLKSLQM